MQTKYLVIFAVVVALGAGLFFYQKNQQKKEARLHRVSQMARVTKVAKKSDIAGLTHMGASINKFREAKGHYPGSLSELYPEFVPYKPFITEIDWTYKPQKNDFVLQKSAEGGSKDKYAAIGSDLKLKNVYRLSDQTERVAAVDVDTSVSAQQKGEALDNDVKTTGKSVPDKDVQASPDTVQNKEASEYQMTSGNEIAAIAPPQPVKTLEAEILADESRLASAEGLKIKKEEIFDENNITRMRLEEDEKFLLMCDDSLYIWKTDEGTIGFSNIQYPDQANLAYYVDNNWVLYNDDSKRQLN